MWVRKVIKVGKALGLVVPAQVCRDLNIKRGDYVVLKMLEDTILSFSKLGDSGADKILRENK